MKVRKILGSMALCVLLGATNCLASGSSLKEMSIEELRVSLGLVGDNIGQFSAGDYQAPRSSVRGRSSRPSTPKAGSVYMDVYQESPVLIDYKGNGNQVVDMSFAVVYKYLKDSSGQVEPHFVRSHLVSTGKEGHRTSIGEFDLDSRHRYYVSNTYGSEMDFAQFFIGGIAIHETPSSNYEILGGPASHGCVRQHRKDAEAMWNLLGQTIDDGGPINIKVYPFNAEVVLADGSSGRETYGFGAKLNKWLNNSIECTRRGNTSRCTTGWEKF